MTYLITYTELEATNSSTIARAIRKVLRKFSFFLSSKNIMYCPFLNGKLHYTWTGILWPAENNDETFSVLLRDSTAYIHQTN